MHPTFGLRWFNSEALVTSIGFYIHRLGAKNIEKIEKYNFLEAVTVVRERYLNTAKTEIFFKLWNRLKERWFWEKKKSTCTRKNFQNIKRNWEWFSINIMQNMYKFCAAYFFEDGKEKKVENQISMLQTRKPL